jgi:hypothetical protein
MTVDEAMQILNVKKDATLEEIGNVGVRSRVLVLVFGVLGGAVPELAAVARKLV